MRRAHPEDDMQASFVQWFRLQYKTRIIMSIPNAAKRSLWLARLMRKTGLLKGALDLFIPEPVLSTPGLWLEFKVKPNKPTDDQERFIAAMKARGYSVVVCHSFDQAKDAVKNYFDGVAV